MDSVVVVENPKDWQFECNHVEIVSARDYLTNFRLAHKRAVKVFNLCRSYSYQSTGYYVSLLATARGHKALPSVSTLVDFRLSALIRIAGEELEELINKSFAPLHSDEFVLSIYFGKNVARRYDRLASRIFRIFPAPFIRCIFTRDGEKSWRLKNIHPIPANEIPADHLPDVVQFAEDFFENRNIPTSSDIPAGRFSLAILQNPDDEEPPSDAKALQKFRKAAEKMDFNVEFITREDYARLAEFDALFIRETTNVNHHTFRFARRAQAEGLVVIDDPDSILRCSNKVYLAELLTRAKIPIPKSMIVHKDNILEVSPTVGLPCILKQPDSAFSRGVIKVETEEELQTECKRLLDKSELIIAQQFLPTEFDWRIGIMDGKPLYVCRYFMAKKHWQVVSRDAKGHSRWGKSETIPLWQAPRNVISTALQAASLIGDGLYGVDLKEVGGKCYIIEVNDNPDVVAGYEDAELKDELYNTIMSVFLERVERRKERKIAK
ncbi:MAG: RimK family protein [Candidatus Sumerlaeia bacterium]|nr:RimK family protein [Candidatus Sumerlaeia bacterium]